ncbi:MAG: phospholipid carrier-dependent glycosyltransferase [Methanosarcinaceae archaeon]|nr:phospholipid carrier-dependent glycosyltransferase [Methanosarcinaceae archaeon]
MLYKAKAILTDIDFWKSWRPKLTKKDLFWILLITAVYAVIAFSNLGSFDAPQTYWNSSKPYESVLITFDSASDVSRIYFYGGISKPQNFTVDFYDSNMNLINSREIEYKLNTMFRWHIHSANTKHSILEGVKYVKITAKNAGFTAFEFGFLAPDDNFVQIESGILSTTGKPFNVLNDEQNTIPYHPTYMHRTYFDEIYHARTAYEHLNEMEPYDTSHPPLGKVLISVGIKIFGMVPFGWRFMGTLLGVLMLPFMYLTVFQLFGRRSLSVLATLALAFDFMHYAQTRISTIDGISTFFVLLMFYFMFRYVTLLNEDVPFKYRILPLALSGFFMGCGVSVKWNCVYAGIGLAIIFFATHIAVFLRKKKEFGSYKSFIKSYFSELKNTFLFCIFFFVIIPLIIYSISYIPHLSPSGYSLESLINAQKHMLDFHTSLRSTHPYASPWWSWPLMLKPIWYYVDIYASSGMTGNIYSFGNPAVWWPGIVSVLLIPFAMLVQKKWRFNIPAFCISVSFFIQYLPWMFVGRTTYIYYYFPCSIFATIAIFWWLSELLKRVDNIKNSKTKRNVNYVLLASGIIYAAIIVGFFILYYPIISGAEITKEHTDFLKTVLIQMV